MVSVCYNIINTRTNLLKPLLSPFTNIYSCAARINMPAMLVFFICLHMFIIYNIWNELFFIILDYRQKQ